MPGDTPTNFTEIKELLDAQHKAAKESREALELKHGNLDGIVSKLSADIEASGAARPETKEAFQAMVDKVARHESDLDALSKKVGKVTNPDTGAVKSLGELILENKSLSDWERGPLSVAKYNGPFLSKAVTGLPASAGALVTPERLSGIVTPEEQPLMVRDLLPVIPVSVDSVDYVRELLFTNNAAVQAAEGARKAESNITFELDNANTKTIAHFIKISRQIASDATTLLAYITGRMQYGLKLEEEQQLLFGTGAGTTIKGLMPQAAAYDVAALGEADDTQLDELRRAIGQVRRSQFAASGICITPEMWTDIQLLKTDDNAYLWANPQDSGEPRIWGKRVVEVDSFTGNQYLVGAFNLGADILDRSQVEVRLADQNEDDFVNNLVTLLVEERVGLVVRRPQAFVQGVYTAIAA